MQFTILLLLLLLLSISSLLSLSLQFIIRRLLRDGPRPQQEELLGHGLQLLQHVRPLTAAAVRRRRRLRRRRGRWRVRLAPVEAALEESPSTKQYTLL